MIYPKFSEISRLASGDLAKVILSAPQCRFALVRRGDRPAEWISRDQIQPAIDGVTLPADITPLISVQRIGGEA